MGCSTEEEAYEGACYRSVSHQMGITITSEVTAVGNNQAPDYRRPSSHITSCGSSVLSVKPLVMVTRAGYDRIVPNL